MASGIKSGVSAFVLLIPAIFITVILYFIPSAQLWYGIVWEVAALIFVLGILLVSIGSMKLGKYYKNILPSVAGILGLVGAIIGLVGVITGFIVAFVPVAVLVGQIANIMAHVAFVLEGIFFILFGVALIVLRDKIGLVGLSIGVGIMAIIAGAILCPEILVPILGIVGMIVLIPTAICAAYLLTKAKGIPEEEVKKVKKLVVRTAEAKEKPMKPEEIEDEVYKYVRKHPGGIDVAECADSLGISERDVEKVINTLVKKGKLEIG
jgi:hypothetical protein